MVFTETILKAYVSALKQRREGIKIYIGHLTKCFCVLVEARFLRVDFKIALSEENDKFLKNEEQIYKEKYMSIDAMPKALILAS